MTATTLPQAATAARRSPWNLVSAEIMKVRTTNTWWLFGIAMVAATLVALGLNMLITHYQLSPPLSQYPEETRAQAAAEAAAAHTTAGLVKITANLLTSGQYLGLLFALLIGALIVTNEYFHQTATATFLTTPHRTAVIVAKLAAGAVFGALFWLVSTVIDLVATPLYMGAEGVTAHLTDPAVIRSVLLNLLAFVMWSVFGLGLGTLIRSQIGAVIVGIVAYVLSDILLSILVPLLHNLIDQDWVYSLRVVAPTTASAIMITPGQAFEHAPPQWAGLLVMVGYVLVVGGIGVLLTRSRDIS
jgi:ABC-type transport system involved in multi-copper enzyme maturation permease subunit